jgi:hypothetical protein
MATYDINAQLTLLEVARRKNPNGDSALIAEVVNETNEVMQDIVWMEANGATFHQATRRTSVPAGETRKYNSGVGTGASTTEVVTEGMAMIEKYAENDKAVIDLFDDKAAARMSESNAILEGMTQTFVKMLFNRALGVNYGSTAVDVTRFNGFPERTKVLQTSGLVVNAGGSGNDTTSAYFVQWGLNTVFCTYPKGSQAGLYHEDKGQCTVSRATTGSPETNQFEAYRDWFKIHGGLFVKDPRCVARIANIETTGTSNLITEDLIIDVITRMPKRGRGAVMYCNNTVYAQLMKRVKDKSNVFLSLDDLFGEKIKLLNILGVPIRQVDEIGNTETAIT